MQLLETNPDLEDGALRRWIYASLAILMAAFTTWALHVTQETWRPPAIVQQESRIDAETSNPEIVVLEAELSRIQSRLDELRSQASQ